MNTIDLIVLGLLVQKPQGPYDIKKEIQRRNLSRWVRIGSFTVYKKVAQYEAKGYVTSQIIQEERKPKKTLYTITDRGAEAFRDLMRKFSEAPTRVFLDFNAVIVNLSLVDEALAQECLDGIRRSIENTREQIERSIAERQDAGSGGRAILDQQLMLLETLGTWEARFEKSFAEERDEK